MKPLLIAGLLSAWMIDQANAQVYYSYPEWNRLDDSARAIYMSLRLTRQHREFGYRACLSALFKVRSKQPAHV